MVHYVGMLIVGVSLIAGCGKKDAPVTLIPEEILTGNKEIVISLDDPDFALPLEMTTPATETMPAVSQVVLPPGSIPQASPQVPSNKQIQQALQNAGFYQGPIDGIVGKKTVAAIKDFQKQHKLTIDGKAGKQTWSKLAPYLQTPSASTQRPKR